MRFSAQLGEVRARKVVFGLLAAFFMGVLQPAVANAEMIAFFANTNYVDMTREGDNIRTSLQNLGHTVNEFTGITASAFNVALDSNWILVLPEMERGNLNNDLDNAARAVLSNHVAGGGLIVQANYFPSNTSLPNALFGYSLSIASPGATTLDVAAAAGTPFAGGPAGLPASNAVQGVLTSSLPGGALNLYHDGSTSSVFQTSFGTGTYIHLGFDWFEEQPIPLAWETILGSAIDSHMMDQVVPEPSTLVLWSLGAVTFVGLGWLRRKRAA